MGDYETLLRAICLEPDEDTPRLAMADWLQEHGGEQGAARAEFIRLQLNPTPDSKRREERILARWGPTWGDEIERDLLRWRAALAVHFPEPEPDQDGFPHLGPLACGLRHVRGFYGYVAISPAEFLSVAGVLFARHPITDLSLHLQYPTLVTADGRHRQADEALEPHRWVRDADNSIGSRGHYLAPELFDRLPSKRRLRGTDPGVAVYPTLVHAFDALEEAALAYGRELRDRIFAGTLPDEPLAPSRPIRPFAGFPDAPEVPAETVGSEVAEDMPIPF